MHAAQYTGDRTTEAYALTYLGLVHWSQGHFRATEQLPAGTVISRDNFEDLTSVAKEMKSRPSL